MYLIFLQILKLFGKISFSTVIEKEKYLTK